MEIRNRDSPAVRDTKEAGIPIRHLKEEEINVCS